MCGHSKQIGALTLTHHCDYCQCLPPIDCTWIVCWFCGRSRHKNNWREALGSCRQDTDRRQTTCRCAKPSRCHQEKLRRSSTPWHARHLLRPCRRPCPCPILPSPLSPFPLPTLPPQHDDDDDDDDDDVFFFARPTLSVRSLKTVAVASSRDVPVLGSVPGVSKRIPHTKPLARSSGRRPGFSCGLPQTAQRLWTAAASSSGNNFFCVWCATVHRL